MPIAMRDGDLCKTGPTSCQKKLSINERFVHESATNGTIFKSKVLKETKVGEFVAVVPEVTGSAYVTGMHTFVIDPDDPIQEGFTFKYR